MSGGVTYSGPNSGSSSSRISSYCSSESISPTHLPVAFVLSLWDRALIRADTVSWTMAAAPTTVGTPMASTGIPRLSFVRLCRWFPTPEPGWIPVSVSWMVVPSLRTLLAARASMTISIWGRVWWMIPFKISAVSIPV